MDYSVTIALILRAHRAFLNGNLSSASVLTLCRIRRKITIFYLVCGRFVIVFFGQYNHQIDITSKFFILQAFLCDIIKKVNVFLHFFYHNRLILFVRFLFCRGQARDNIVNKLYIVDKLAEFVGFVSFAFFVFAK